MPLNIMIMLFAIIYYKRICLKFMA
jgi:hypothetical protein